MFQLLYMSRKFEHMSSDIMIDMLVEEIGIFGIIPQSLWSDLEVLVPRFLSPHFVGH